MTKEEALKKMIKDVVFDLCRENYNLDLEDVGDYTFKAMKKNEPRHKEIYDEIVWRVQDYEDVERGITEGLNYEYLDYKYE